MRPSCATDVVVVREPFPLPVAQRPEAASELCAVAAVLLEAADALDLWN
jgi:hypothetical protein